ncbi:MAG: SDR family oxidoreductase [Alphaproteobacteria bacterium]|nr:SDR family oxidoreductase [Alphaproteobacteria bacterium]
MEFNGKTALVTGANGGIGKAIVQRLKDAGAKVAAADMTLDGLEGSEVDLLLPGDLQDSAYTRGLPQAALDALGGLDIIINNAGVMRRGAVTASSDEDFELSVAINVKAPFQICRAAIPLMAERGGGVVVNTSSCWGVHPGPDHAIYCMTKAAIASLTQCMGRDHAHQGIRVNAVCPNEVDTPMLRTGFEMRGFDPETAITQLGETVPLGYVATPGDIADVVMFLASDAARYMCGALVEVNGGKPVG